MPNLTHNILKVSVSNAPDRHLLISFHNENKKDDKPLSFESSAPVESIDCDNCRAVWGCKWDAEFGRFTSSATELVYVFNTPWCAPTKWFKVVAEKYPNLRFELKSSYEDDSWPISRIVRDEDGECKYSIYKTEWIKTNSSFIPQV